MQTVIDAKWKQARGPLIGQAVVYLLIAIIVSVYATVAPHSLVLKGLVITFCVYLLTTEALQSAKDNLSYISDPWNCFDLISATTLLTETFITSIVVSVSGFVSTLLLSVALACVWFRVLGYLRIFDGMRLLVRLVIESLKDLKSFAILLLVLCI